MQAGCLSSMGTTDRKGEYLETNMAQPLLHVCTLCYSDYNLKLPVRIPKRLECDHTFCADCIEKLKDLQGQAIECPLCQKPTLIPLPGVESLATNLDAVGLGEPERVPDVCSHCVRKVYPPKPVTLFCRDCETSYCGNCSDAEHLKPENIRHSIVLDSVKSSFKTDNMTSVSQSIGNDWSRLSSAVNIVESLPQTPQIFPRASSSHILDVETIPDCPVHSEKMRIYCRTDRCLCCSYCETIGDHKGHDCFQVHEAEERERAALQRLQEKVDLHSERFIKARGDVQRMIEDVKKNSVTVKDVARRYFRELRATIDKTEKNLLSKLNVRGERNLKRLREQLSKMIEISSIAKTASRNCDNALSFDYYEMLLRRKAVEEEMHSVLEMMVATEPVAKANLHCQFPKHESLLNDIRTCSFIVEAPPPPANFHCSVSPDKKVIISWDNAEDMQYIYPPLHYILQASIGSQNSFVDVCKTKVKSVIVNPKEESFPPGEHIQFRVCAENIVSKGPFCHPFGIKVPYPK